MLGLVAVVSAAACVFLIVVMVSQGLARAGAWAGPLAALAGIVAAAAAVWVTMPRPSTVPLPPELGVPDWVVGRPAELAAVVKALVGGRAGTVGITTGLYGAGGFGKTTLAQMVCADRQVRRRFRGRVHFVTVGRDVRGAAAVSARINDVIKLVAGEDATFTDPQLAGRRLGSLLDAGPRRLLVLDDVWEQEQLAPFAEGGRRCARLVTTRVPELVAGRGTAVQVDQMSPDQARVLLTSGLPQLDPVVAEGLLKVTGRWPLLLRLVSKILADYARVAADVSAQGEKLLERLRVGGPAVVDDLLGDAGRGLDVGQPQKRARAVRATIGASTSLLDENDAERFAELGVFAEDEIVPFSLVARLWRATAGLDELQAAQVCNRLAQLALVSHTVDPAHGITVHDVVRDFLRAELGQQRLARLTGVLLGAIGADLPAASPLDPDALCPIRAAWWDLDHDERYLWDHLIEHLLDAGCPDEAEAVAEDLRWVGARLERFGPAAPAADLSTAGTPRATRLRAALARAAHLLAPTEPAAAVVDVLHSRVADDPDWGRQVTALRDICRRPRLVNRWPLPDLADPALRRVLTCHASAWAVVVAPDGNWLASGSGDGTVQIWDVATGQERATITAHTGTVAAVAVAPDGSWLATGGTDGKVRIWEVATGQERATMTRRKSLGVEAVTVAPDGSWLATGGRDGTVRIWDVATGQEQATLTGHTNWVEAVAIAPDGSWLASGGGDGTVRIWDVATGQERATLTSLHLKAVEAVAIAPDGSWLASGGGDGTVRIWDVATGQERATLTSHSGEVMAVVIAPDGSWLATGGRDGTVRIWDVATGQERATLAGYSAGFSGEVMAVVIAPDGSWLATGGREGKVRIWDVASAREPAMPSSNTTRVEMVAPDGSWLATSGTDGTVRIWDVATGQERVTLTDPYSRRVVAVAVAPDGSWLAIGGREGTVRIWDAATGQERASLTGHTNWVEAVAVAPDGSWLAIGGTDGTVRIWDVATGQERATLTDPYSRRVVAVAVAPDGSWLAIGGTDGTVRIWDAVTGQERATLTGHTVGFSVGVIPLAVAPDGGWLATGGTDGTVRIWDVATGQERVTLTDPYSRRVVALAVAPDGSWLATGGTDGTVRIWDAATGQERATLTDPYSRRVVALAVAPDGSWLATSGTDGTVRIWDAATGQERASLTGHTNWVEAVAVAVAPDGSWLATGGTDGTVRIWDAVTGQARAMMRLDNSVNTCEWAGPNALAVRGTAGLCLFDFLTGTSPGA